MGRHDKNDVWNDEYTVLLIVRFNIKDTISKPESYWVIVLNIFVGPEDEEIGG